MSVVDCDIQVERQAQTEAEKRDFLQRIAEREEALHQANVSSEQCCSQAVGTQEDGFSYFFQGRLHPQYQFAGVYINSVLVPVAGVPLLDYTHGWQ